MTRILTRRPFLAGGAAAATGLAASPRRSRAQGTTTTLTLANSQWLDALRGKNLWNALLQYQSAAPGVRLEQEAIPAAEFDKKLTTEFGAGQGPDIAMMQEGLFYSIADAGFLADLDPAVQGAPLNGTNGNGVVNGKRLGVGWQRAVYALIYNKPLLDKGNGQVPTDVDGLIGSARSAMSATGAVGLAARYSMSEFSAWFMDFDNWFYGYGGRWVDAKGKLTIDTAPALAAFSAFKQAYDAKIIPVGDDMPTQRNRFKENRVVFSIDSSGGTLNVATGGAMPSRDLHAAALPFPSPGAHQQIFLAVNDGSRNKPAALGFVRWLVSPPGQQALRDASGPDTLATDVPMGEAFAAANPWGAPFVELARTSRSTLIPGHEVDTTAIMRPVMEGLEKVLVSGADPKAMLAAAQRQVDQKF